LDKFEEWFSAEENVILLDDHDNAIVGVNYQDGIHLCYSVEAIVENLVGQGMTEEEAFEYYEYNIEGSRFSENEPIYIQDFKFDSEGKKRWQ
jgi:hypothetical protein